MFEYFSKEAREARADASEREACKDYTYVLKQQLDKHVERDDDAEQAEVTVDQLIDEAGIGQSLSKRAHTFVLQGAGVVCEVHSQPLVEAN